MKRTMAWLWGMIVNPPIVWTDADTGEFSHTEQANRFRGRFTRWSMRPMWFHTVLTTSPGCGCRKRLGLWNTIWCMDHAGFSLDDEQ